MKKWTKEDANLAARQGWECREIYDIAKRRFEHQIFKDDRSKIFLTDEIARKWVVDRMAMDALAQKAFQIVFTSKTGRAA